jgi:two-component system, NtrC family, response regulator HupR/HoxA
MEVLAGMQVSLDDLVGGSEAMQTIYQMVERLANSDIPVLIGGETGTGKGLLARTIHARSARTSKPFMHQSCASLSHELLESELFGHSRGAFTGALSDRQGLFEAADGGTVFLDEIGDAPPEVQVRLLHVLEEGNVRRVGENSPRDVDVRVIAATNKDLEEEVRAGRFREDLYYRLRVVPIQIPPLRERAEDLRLLVDHFLKLYAPAQEREIAGLAPETAAAFAGYEWPGNIRELENELRRGVALADEGGTIDLRHVSHRIAANGLGEDGLGQNVQGPLKQLVARFEDRVIRAALADNGWNVTHTAERLGLSRVGLQGKMRKYHIARPK